MLFITDDDHYWNGPIEENMDYADFSVKDGRIVETGTTLRWQDHSIDKTKRDGRCSEPIHLKNRYSIKWKSFSDTGDDKFRYLLLPGVVLTVDGVDNKGGKSQKN